MEESLEEPWGKPVPAAREGGGDASVGEGSVGAGLAAGKNTEHPFKCEFQLNNRWLFNISVSQSNLPLSEIQISEVLYFRCPVFLLAIFGYPP